MSRRRILVIGSGSMFVSGISYYTHQLALALSQRHDVSVTLMRKLTPVRLYPGATRAGAAITDLSFPAEIRVHDGVDWHGGGMADALRLIDEERPDVVVMQWWTATVAHHYLVLARAARRRGARVVLELHEVQDPGEMAVPGAAAYGRGMLRALLHRADAAVVHSRADLAPLAELQRGRALPTAVIPHGPFTQYRRSAAATREAPPGAVNILFFGTIRPYKGAEDLVEAFGSLPRAVADRLWLTVVGETWSNWELPAREIAVSPHRDRITFVNRYVTDVEAAGWLAGADAMALPYRRSSASGPLHVAMSHGLPVIVTDLPSLREAVGGYTGARFVAPFAPAAIARELTALAAAGAAGVGGGGVGEHADPRGWSDTVASLEGLIGELEPSSV